MAAGIFRQRKIIRWTADQLRKIEQLTQQSSVLMQSG